MSPWSLIGWVLLIFVVFVYNLNEDLVRRFIADEVEKQVRRR